MFCIYCGTQLDEGAVICPSCNAAVNYSGAAMAAQNPLKDPRGMKWFQFIIYFQLFVSALNVLVGGIYGAYIIWSDKENERVFAAFPGLKFVLAFAAVFGILLVVSAIVIRMKLARFRRHAPLLYWCWSGARILYPLLLGFGMLAVTNVYPSSTFGAESISRMFSKLIVLVLNVIYFKKRADLFVK